jgi:hypothetical protein
MENVGLIIALCASAFTIIGAMIAMMLWVRGEANSDRRALDAEHKQLRRDMIDIMRAIELEMRDFHSRMCAIEERRKPL